MNAPAPDFSLADLQGKRHFLHTYRGRVVVLEFWSARCPVVLRADNVVRRLRSEWPREIAWVCIACNADELLEEMRREAERRGLPTVLCDPSARVADLYRAEATPHFFLVDAEGILRYRGALDDTTMRQRDPTVNYLDQAVRALLAGRPPQPAETHSYGCAIVRRAPSSRSERACDTAGSGSGQGPHRTRRG